MVRSMFSVPLSQARALLPLLEPVESCVQDLAAVSRSFSLFSRRYLEEGLEQTSVNSVLQHVDTIYNVGSVLRQARLNWERLTPDILIYTQTAKLVMLLISLLRSVASEGGTQLDVKATLEDDGLQILLRYKPTSNTDHVAIQPDVDVAFDPELNEGLIEELCSELDIQHSQQREGPYKVHQLKMRQSHGQACLG
jgi:hypothetical protein